MQAPTCPSLTESKVRLLYVGTDLELITAIRQVLTEPEYWLVACSDQESAILFLRSEIPYDLLLIDLEWRGKEGLKLARLAHSLRHRRRMPIILVTAKKLSSAMNTSARRAGVKECVTKTPDMGAVSEAIRERMGEKGKRGRGERERRQKAEGRRQRAEVMSDEVGGQRSEARSRRSEVGGQRSV
jgi:response regulator RpfG family c-di-GMP phosphodiesterase